MTSMSIFAIDNGFTQVQDIDSVRAAIDQEIAQLQAQIFKLRIRRNSLSPINRIPPEILSQIMGECQVDVDFHRWFGVTQVSHHWRSVALGSPLLWTTITCPTLPPFWVGEHIRRSGCAPLSISISSGYRYNHQYRDKVLPMLAGVADRVVSFMCHGGLSPDLEPNFSSSPLERLKLILCSRIWENLRTTPHLRYLRIEFGCFNMGLISQGLTTLILKALDRPSLPSLSEFYKTLSLLTRLESLSLWHVLSFMSQPAQPSVPDLSLPSLDSLELVEAEGECTRFLSHVHLPSLTRLNITIVFKEPTSLSALRATVSKMWLNSPILTSPNLPRVHAKVQLSGFRSFQLINPDERALIFQLMWMVQSSEMQPFYSILESFPKESFLKDKLQALHVEWGNYPTDNFMGLLLAFSKMPLLKQVTLEVRNMHHILAFIPSCCCIHSPEDRKFERSSASRPPPSVLPACASCQKFSASFFPEIRILTLDISRVNFDPRDLMRFLAHRADCGRPLEKLEIRIAPSLNFSNVQYRLEVHRPGSGSSGPLIWILWENQTFSLPASTKTMPGIGPEIPPHLLPKVEQSASDDGSDDDASFGPQLPADLVARQPNSRSPPREQKEQPTASQGGAQIGPQVGAQPQDDDDDDDDDYTPALPPDMATSRAPTSLATAVKSAGAGPSRRPAGPLLPSQQRYFPDEDDDDDFGPKPLPAGVTLEEPSAVQKFMEQEERRRKNLEEAAKPKAPKREEWMLVPPTSSELLGGLDPSRMMKGRQFSRSTAPAQKSDTSLWTETPAERQQRIADEVSGKRRRVVDEANGVEDEEERKRRKRDEAIVRRGVEEYTSKIRGPALVDQHKERQEESVPDPKESVIWDHSRDMSIGGRLMDDSKRNQMIREARSLGDRFGSGKTGGFL
ncbi:hypothetical protein AX16_002129 [Volvariella volvacea WC 439]|nr:hypothetical protein AX16_002129 [Volvariella volvacea WC 439]